jgi:hypothetical protein
MSIVNKPHLRKEGFVCYAGPFLPYEEDMIPKFINEAIKNNKDVREEIAGNGIYLWQRSKNVRN